MAKRTKRAKGVTVADLKDDYGSGRVFLYCEVCGAEFSACKGDYWNMAPSEIFMCDHNAEETGEDALYGGMPPLPMRLVREETRLVDLVEVTS